MTAPFPNRPRADAREKVMGAARYGADHQVAGLLYAMQVPATIAKGRIAALSIDAAMQVPGVVRVLTSSDFLPPPPATPGAPPPPATLTTDIAYRGQPVALVAAETLEAAIEGAEAIRPIYTVAPAFTSLIDQPGMVREGVKPVTAGDAMRAMARAVTRHKADYVSPPQHHNPIEMLSTTAIWENGQLTIYESTQSSSNNKGCRHAQHAPYARAGDGKEPTDRRGLRPAWRGTAPDRPGCPRRDAARPTGQTCPAARADFP